MVRNGLELGTSCPILGFSAPIQAWFRATFPEGATPAQELTWPAIASDEHVLLIAPTGTGKTLAAFLAILDRLFRAELSGTLPKGIQCVYVSPLRSLSYDIERNLRSPIDGIWREVRTDPCPVRIGVRTG